MLLGCSSGKLSGNEFLSQQEVDSLLRGFGDDVPADPKMTLLDSWEMNGETYFYIRLALAEINELATLLTEAEYTVTTASYRSYNFVVIPKSTYVLLTLKWG